MRRSLPTAANRASYFAAGYFGADWVHAGLAHAALVLAPTFLLATLLYWLTGMGTPIATRPTES
ncbi:MAG: hypothetical protein ACHQWU_16910 [Gemmatimonadales bacterium]